MALRGVSLRPVGGRELVGPISNQTIPYKIVLEVGSSESEPILEIYDRESAEGTSKLEQESTELIHFGPNPIRTLSISVLIQIAPNPIRT